MAKISADEYLVIIIYYMCVGHTINSVYILTFIVHASHIYKH